jgi:hypothetical protein
MGLIASGQRSSRAVWIAAMGGISLLAVWARIAVLPQVFIAGQVLTRDPDADYHLRRIAQTLESFPAVPIRDPALNWPEGAICPWAPGFDWLGSLFAAGFGVLTGEVGSDRAASFFPVLLGLVLVWGVVELARRLVPADRTGDSTALAAGALAALLPRLVMSSQLGRVDHHVFEALSMLALGLWVLWAAAENPDHPHSRPAWLLFELAGCSIAFTAGAGFAGSMLYVALAGSILMGLRLWQAQPTRARRGAWALLGSGAPAVGFAALFLAILARGAVVQHGQALGFRLPSYLQPLIYGAVALGCLQAALVASLDRSARRPGRRLVRRLAAVAGLGALFLLALFPIAGEPVHAGLVEWVARRDPWLARIAEFQPLFPSWQLWRIENLAPLYHFNALPGLLAPVAIPLGVWRACRERRVAGACFGVWTLVLVVLTLMQNRFGQVLSANYAVCLALALSWGLEQLSRVLERRALPATRTPVALGAALALLCLADPAIRDELRWHGARPLTAIEEVSLFLARESRAEEDAPGVLARWDYGHTILHLADRPVLAAGFGHWTGRKSFEASESFMFGSESELMELMEQRRLSWVVTGMRAPFPDPNDPSGNRSKPLTLDPETKRVIVNALYFARFPLTSLILGGGGQPQLGIPHVAHLMPRHVSTRRAVGIDFPVHELWLFERVAGARLAGHADPGARVEATTELSIRGTPTSYIAWTKADPGGRYELVVPLPNGLRQAALSSGPRYALSIDGAPSGEATISEHDVRAGLRVTATAGHQHAHAR